MCHPKNRHERFIVGMHKGIRRSKGFSKDKREENAKRLRNMTKFCSCVMCGNPRRKSWKNKLTMQEKKFFESTGL